MKFDFIFGKLELGNDNGPSAVEIVRLSEEIVNTQKVSRHTISGIILTASKWDGIKFLPDTVLITEKEEYGQFLDCKSLRLMKTIGNNLKENSFSSLKL